MVKRLKNRVSLVLFDLGGVIFYYRGGLKEIARQSKKSYDEVLEIFKRHDEFACRGIISSQELWNRMKKDMKASHVHIADFLEFWVSNFAPIYSSHNLIQNLVKNGIDVGLITNIYRGTLKKAFANGHIPNIKYKIIVQSCKIGFIKPEREMFAYAQKKAGVQPSEIMLIDDSEENIKKAKELGWCGIIFDEENSEKSVVKIKEFIMNPKIL